MEHDQDRNLVDLTGNVEQLRIDGAQGTPQAQMQDILAGEINPWGEIPSHLPTATASTSITSGVPPDSILSVKSTATAGDRIHVSEDLLNEFDPLVDASKSTNTESGPVTSDIDPRTYATMDGSPSSQRRSSPSPPQTPPKPAHQRVSSGPTTPQRSSTPLPQLPQLALASLTNFAKSLASSTSSPSVSGASSFLGRPRPRSVDLSVTGTPQHQQHPYASAHALTPNTISSFAAQQQQKHTSAAPTPLKASITESGDKSPLTPSQQSGPGGSASLSNLAADPSERVSSPRPGKERERTDNEDRVRNDVPPSTPASVGPPPFDFQKFLDQMKTKSAEPVAKYLRSFLSNFAKRTLTVTDQVKVINEFLNFISQRMRESDIWRNVSEVEFDNAMEAMEKLVMNRLYEFTFTPQLAEAVPPRPITTDDLERDRVLAQRIALFGWVEEKHLDISCDDDEGPENTRSTRQGFMMFAQQELLKINHYKAPRDKLICILNCCKVIFGLIRHLHREENADSFLPILIYVVLKSNPPNLLSNVEYINRFRNPQKLQSEAGYYLSSLMGAVHFIESMDHSSLSNITAEEFEINVEQAIQNLPDSPPAVGDDVFSNPATGTGGVIAPIPIPKTPPRIGSPGVFNVTGGIPIASPSGMSHAGEESATPLALSLSFADDTRRFLQRTGDTLSKPLSALGRILNEALDVGQTPVSATGGGVGADVIAAPYKARVRSIGGVGGGGESRPGTPDGYGTPTRFVPGSHRELALANRGRNDEEGEDDEDERVGRTATPAIDIAGLQAEIDRAHERASSAALGTLEQIFPAADREVIEWVLEAEEGDLGRSIEKLLEMT